MPKPNPHQAELSLGTTQSGGKLSHSERIACLRLIRSENIGPITFRDLIAHCGSAEAAVAAVPELSRRGGRSIRLCPREDAEAEIGRAENLAPPSCL